MHFEQVCLYVQYVLYERKDGVTNYLFVDSVHLCFSYCMSLQSHALPLTGYDEHPSTGSPLSDKKGMKFYLFLTNALF